MKTSSAITNKLITNSISNEDNNSHFNAARIYSFFPVSNALARTNHTSSKTSGSDVLFTLSINYSLHSTLLAIRFPIDNLFVWLECICNH